MITLDRLPAVSLAEMDEVAALGVRRDRKYLLAADELTQLLGALGTGTRALEIDGRRRFGYRSVYFDDSARRLYLATAHARPRRTKVRTRTYTDAGQTLLEVKVRDGRGRTVKHRFAACSDGGASLDLVARDAVAGIEERLADAELEPTLVTRFTRSTLLLPRGGRATIDIGLTLEVPNGASWSLTDVAVVETKSLGAPTEVDRRLWRARLRPVRFSKFGTGLAGLYPDLPANRWHRALVFLGRTRRSLPAQPLSLASHDPLTSPSLHYGHEPHATT